MTRHIVSPFPAKRLKHVVSLRRSRVDGNEDDRPYVGLENIESWTGKLIGNLETDEASSAVMVDGTSLSNIFEPGDVLFGKLRPYLAKAWVAEFPGRSTTELLVMHPMEIEPRFLRYVFLWHDFVDAVDASTFGSRMPRADWDFIGNMSVPIPEWRKQRAIADYLDREVARLDALMAEKKRLLDLLADKRRALVNRAVTRGLDPNVPHRDSGSPWLGEIPAHWKIGRLKQVGLLIAGSGFPHDFQGVIGNPLPFYKVGDLSLSSNNRHVEKAPNTVSYETASELHAHVIPNGSIIYAKIGAALLLNRRRITTVPCCIDNNMTAYVPNNNDLTSEWAFYWTQILDFGMLVNPGAVPSLSEGDQAQLPIAIPPLDEQLSITNHLDFETAQINALVGETEQTVSLLRERRSALISAAITGQLEVT